MREIMTIVENADSKSGIDEPHLYYYHVTPARNIKSISANGLVPQKGRRSKKIGEESDGIYLFYNLKEVEIAINGWLGLEFTESSRLALLRVIVPEGSGVRYGGGYERIITTPIPAENIKVLTRDLFGEVGLEHLDK